MQWAGLLRTVTSRYPLNTPRASILDILPDIPSDFGEFLGKNGHRYRGYWSTRDEVCRSLFWFGDFDPWVCQTLTRLARPHSTALDIGANIGATALTLAKAVGPKGRVVCFEPVPQNIDYLRQNIAANGTTWIDIVPQALSNAPGELVMVLPDNRPGRSRVSTHNDQPGFKVQSVKFDDWLVAQPRLDISVCKIDVEDHELHVFSGMEQTLSNHLVPAFVFERHSTAPVLRDPVFSLLQSKGYRVLRIEKSLKSISYVDIGAPPIARPTPDFVAILPGFASCIC